MITTEAWVLNQGEFGTREEGQLHLETVTFEDPTEDEVLAEPLYGCWETNMSHALARRPVDICRLRCEPKVVLGNSGVVRILSVGNRVRRIKVGDVCTLVPVGELDPHGYMLRIFGYDAPGTIGVLAKLTKLRQDQVFVLPAESRHTPSQWAACSVRYATAWDNWKVAYRCWRAQMPEGESPPAIAWGWGGGVALAELLLAKAAGFDVAMVASRDARLALLRSLGIRAVDRREFDKLWFDEARFDSDREYRMSYVDNERRFLARVREYTNGQRVSIFIDNVGTPVMRATLKALARQGVITTAGWDRGAAMRFSRIDECIQRHIHVHTHGARLCDVREAAEYAEHNAWLPPVPKRIYAWDEIPLLAAEFRRGEIDSYFPIFEVNTP